MQLTNICRDVFDDAAIGRVYLPKDLLREEGADLNFPVTDMKNRVAVVAVVKRLLERAQGLYDSGNRGLISLSFRPACAVSVAKEVYRAIGTEVIRRGPAAWNQRVWTSKGKKIWLMVKGVAVVLCQVPQRLLKPWKPVPLNTLWRHA
jgi:phytoene synthase